MGQKKKLGKGRLDKYYHLAKEQGYRSRAAFKLIQLNKKYNFLGKRARVLDLCAAPGGWLQVASKAMPLGSLIIGVDLAPIKPVRGCKTLVADITTTECRQMLKKEAGGSSFDVVLHDGAPNVGGAWASEAYSQSALVLDSLKLATEFLAPQGAFVTKVFRSQDYNALLYALGALFDKVEATKPQASRNTSAEIFVVCLGFRAPARIDPRLLDPRHLFRDVADAPRPSGPQALLSAKQTQKRHREGYADGVSSSHAPLPALAFIVSDAPIELLGRYTRLVVSGHGYATTTGVPELASWPAEVAAALAADVRDHPASGGEVPTLCSDLQVLGRSEFKALLKWRLAVRKALAPQLDAAAAAAAGVAGDAGDAGDAAAQSGDDASASGSDGGEGETGEEEGEGEGEAALLAEMAAVKDRADKRLKKERKARREMKKKAKLRAAQLSQSEGIGDADAGGPDSLFSLSALTQRRGGVAAAAAAALVRARAPSAAELEQMEEPSSSEQGSEGFGAAGDSDEDTSEAYGAELEAQLDESWRQFAERRGIREAAAAERRQRLGMPGELGEEAGEEGGQEMAVEGEASDDSISDEDIEEGPGIAGGGLEVRLDATRAGVAKSAAAVTAQWFKQDVFGGLDVLAESSEEEEEEEEAAAAAGASAATPVARASRAAGKLAQPVGGAADGDALRPTKRARGAAPAAPPAMEAAGGGFEVVAADVSGSSDSDSGSEDEFDALDDQGKAEVLALAKRMLRDKEKQSIMDAAYNRFAFHDDRLPRWFTEDERRHMQPIPQVTKAEVEEEKARLAAVDARPIKKVVEAKARKQKRMQAQLDRARSKATAIADQEDVPMSSKMREIEKLYAKARAAGSGKGKKGGKDSKRKGPPLDRRMKSDKRGADAAARRGGGGKGKGKGRVSKGGVAKRSGKGRAAGGGGKGRAAGGGGKGGAAGGGGKGKGKR